MACELVRLNGNRDDDVAFSFAKSAADLEHAIKSKQSAAAISLVRALQPYYGGNDQLRAIHDLDILDTGTSASTAIPSGQLTTMRSSLLNGFLAPPRPP